MTDATASTPQNSLLFPAFMYGDKTTCRRKMKAEAKKWAKCYGEGRPFPEPKLIPIPPGSVVFIDEGYSNWVGGGYSMIAPNVVNVSANPKGEGLNIQWRAYLLRDLLYEAELIPKLRHEACLAFRHAVVTRFWRFPWAAISATSIGVLSSIEFTTPRIEGVLQHWDALDTLRYIDFGERPISLTTFMTHNFDGNVAMWVDQPTGNIRIDLATAIAQMRKASDEEVYRRVVKRLGNLADIDKDLKHPEWLKSPGVIEAGIRAYRNNGQEWYDNLTSGAMHELGRFLVLLEQNYGPGSEHFDPSFGKKP